MAGRLDEQMKRDLCVSVELNFSVYRSPEEREVVGLDMQRAVH